MMRRNRTAKAKSQNSEAGTTPKLDAANPGPGEPTADGGQPPARNRQPATDPDLERRKSELYARLLRAVEARKSDRSAYYAPSLRHGLHCPDLDRSAAATGENPEGLKAHLRLFDRVFGGLLGFASQRPKTGESQKPGADHRQSSNPQSPDPLPVDARSPLAPKLTRALALLMWLPMRLMRTQAIWERRALSYRLQELGRWRRRYGLLTPARIDRLRSDLDLLFNQHLDERAWLRRVRRRWLLLWEALFEPSAWAARLARWRRPGARKRTPASANSRLRSARRGPRREVWMRRLDELPPEAIANFSPGHALGAIEKRRKPASVKAPEQWSAWNERVARTLDRMDCRLRRATRDLFGARQPSDAELRGLVKRGTLKVPETFEEFEQLVAAALGPEPAVRSKGPSGPAGAGAAGSLADQGAAHSSSLAETASSLPACGTTPPKPVISSPFVPPLRTVLSAAKELRVNCARNPALKIKAMQDSSSLAAPRNDRLDDFYHSPLEGKARRSAVRSVPKKKRLNAPKLKTQGVQGSVAAPPAANPGPATDNPPLETGPPSETANRQFAEALWQRVNFFAGRADELEQLLHATLDWDTSRLPRLWWRLLPPDHAGECVMALLRHTDARARALAARSGISLAEAWRRAEAESRPPAPWESQGQAIGGRGHEPRRSRKSSVAGGKPGSKTRALLEMRKFMLDWLAAVDYTGHHANLSVHQVEVTLYDVAVYCFGIHRQFLEWRPVLSSVQLETRRERPEWQVRVMTADGEAWVKLSDGRIFQPEEEQAAGVSGSSGQGVQPGPKRAVVGSGGRWFLGKWNFENRNSKFDILASGF
ncbi:MAG TPA: hypothetical protein VG206_10045 [Terriglobia bacterium]|nr:hypothetical protein [Terriglobia bacterium]